MTWTELTVQDYFPAPPIVVCYGLDQTDKLAVISTVLEAQSLRHVVVRCRECLSQRHLLVRIYAAMFTASRSAADAEAYDRIDSINSLAVALEKLFRTTHQRIILVLDGLDKQKGSSPTLLPALARLGDTVGTCLGK
jgi:origin recognition complex subunit 5